MTSFVDLVAAEIASEWDEMSRIPFAVSPVPDRGRSDRVRERDVLDEILPPDYVQALAGVEVPNHGMVCCPLPDHEDLEPSCKVYDTAERGWYCFGCNTGGDIYTLAALLWGWSRIDGPAFHELRREIARALLRAEP
jgi:hypothetical protein